MLLRRERFLTEWHHHILKEGSAPGMIGGVIGGNRSPDHKDGKHPEQPGRQKMGSHNRHKHLRLEPNILYPGNGLTHRCQFSRKRGIPDQHIGGDRQGRDREGNHQPAPATHDIAHLAFMRAARGGQVARPALPDAGLHDALQNHHDKKRDAEIGQFGLRKRMEHGDAGGSRKVSNHFHRCRDIYRPRCFQRIHDRVPAEFIEHEKDHTQTRDIGNDPLKEVGDHDRNLPA